MRSTDVNNHNQLTNIGDLVDGNTYKTLTRQLRFYDLVDFDENEDDYGNEQF